MGVTLKQMFGLMLFFVTCLVALYGVSNQSLGLSPHLRDATTALVTAMIGGVAAGVYLNFIGLRILRDERDVPNLNLFVSDGSFQPVYCVIR